MRIAAIGRGGACSSRKIRTYTAARSFASLEDDRVREIDLTRLCECAIIISIKYGGKVKIYENNGLFGLFHVF